MAKARILIVEDEAIIASVIAGALRKFDYEVVDILNTGAAAVAVALQTTPDLVLMDIRLQDDVDGIAAAERIQETADIPIIYLTAYADDPTLARAKRTQPYGYIPKPFQEIELRTTIEMALYKHGFEVLLKESEARFRSLFANSQDVIYIVDRAGKLMEMNPAGLDLFGYDRGELIGRELDFLYVDRSDRDEMLAKIWDRHQVKDYEVHLKKKNGEELTALVTASVMTDSQKEVSGFQGILRDVTIKKKLEEQMLQAAKMDSLGRLASGIAHDFNNYLTIINGYSEMLLAESPEGSSSENLRLILQAGKNASKLVAKILGFSRRQAPAPVVIDINAALGDLERMVRRLVGEGIELRIELDPEAGNVRIDPGQLEQALINLVINARDAMPGGGKLVLASAHVQLNEEGAVGHPGLHPGAYVAIRVRDSGNGMEPRVLAHIFEPFFTTKAAGEGTGLGLASVFAVVQQNEGSIWAESVPGQGSTFHLLLPRAGGTPRPEKEERPRRRFDGRTVLLVDDEQGIRELLRSILEKLGMEVHAAADGEEGLRTAAALPRLDLLLSDVVLPGISGIEVAERLRIIHPQAAVILSSGQGEKYLKRAGLDLEKTHFIAKPSTYREIEETIAKALG
jgi:PAS domain S-box